MILTSPPLGGLIFGSITSPIINFASSGTDWRTKLTINGATGLLGGPVLQPLAESSGIIWPYTPTLFIQYSAGYSSSGLTHSNYDHPAFESHQIGSISINCSWTSNTQKEADYFRAVIHFLRTVTKMYFGQDTQPVAGTPPPVLRLNASGDYVFSNVPVVVESWNTDLPQNVDYIQTTDKKSMIPTRSELSVSVKPAYSRQATSQRFGLKEFANGDLLGNSGQGGFV
jgi:hypothetical protein